MSIAGYLENPFPNATSMHRLGYFSSRMSLARKRLLEHLRLRLGGLLDQEQTRIGPCDHLDGQGPQGAPPNVVHVAFAHDDDRVAAGRLQDQFEALFAFRLQHPHRFAAAASTTRGPAPGSARPSRCRLAGHPAGAHRSGRPGLRWPAGFSAKAEKCGARTGIRRRTPRSGCPVSRPARPGRSSAGPRPAAAARSWAQTGRGLRGAGPR